MGDVPFPPEVEPGKDEVFAAKLILLRNKLDDAARVTLTSDPRGRLRRPVLFVLIGVALALNVPALGITALLALALTDQVVEL